MKQRAGLNEDDYYTSIKKKQRIQKIMDEIEDDRLMEQLQDQNMERDLKLLVRKKLDEFTFIGDSIEKWSFGSDSSGIFGEVDDSSRNKKDNFKFQSGSDFVNKFTTSDGGQSPRFDPCDDKLIEDLLPKDHPADEKIVPTKDQLERLEEQQKQF